jgi:uncharacterized protein YijF (DUF1287 family)
MYALRNFIACLLLSLPLVSCVSLQRDLGARANAQSEQAQIETTTKPIEGNETLRRAVEAAIEQISYTKGYDPSYVKIAYPNGDVPRETGVCSDVIVRAFRGVGVDLQRAVHEDMTRHFAEYPQRWHLKQPDANIDHRRVPNLMKFFERQGKSLPITRNADDYRPGDIIAWDLGGGQTHIGMLTNRQSNASGRFLIVHNIGAGARMEDVLFAWKIIGHYRYF